MAVRTKDLEPTAERAEAVKQREAVATTRAATSSLKTKTWDQVTAAEKDQILKAIAIHLGIVAPDAPRTPRAR